MNVLRTGELRSPKEAARLWEAGRWYLEFDYLQLPPSSLDRRNNNYHYNNY